MLKLLVSMGIVFALTNGATLRAQTLYTDNLIAARVIVPDYSPSTGGYGPALSSDGKTIAYTDSKGEIWIQGEVDISHETFGQRNPSKLEFTNPDGVTGPPYRDHIHGRNVDWSPDGKRLAFAYNDWRLHIVDGINIDSVPLVANVQPVTEVKNKEKDYYSVGGPRWSPDGRKIAFVRFLAENSDHQEPAQIWILDVETGSETMVADDLSSHYSCVWGEPWSPDSKFLVYAAEHRDDKGKSDDHRPNIVVVSLDGKMRRTVSDSGGGSGPSFHPKLSKVVYNGPVTYRIGCPGWEEGDFSLDKLWTVDRDGKNRQLACPTQEPNKLQLKQAANKMIKIAASQILEDLKGYLTQQEARRLHSGVSALSAVADIATAAVARKIGGAFRKATENMLMAKRKDSAAYKQAVENYKEAMQKLSEEQRYIAYTYTVGLYTPAAMKGLLPYSRSDSRASWSPDGSRLAFVRYSKQAEAVYCLDLKTGHVYPLIELGVIDSTTWTADGKYLIVQGKRTTAIEQVKVKVYQRSTAGLVHTIGYPEIWMLQPK